MPDSPPHGGLWLSDIGLYSGYYSSGISHLTMAPGALPSDMAVGGTATLNFLLPGEREQFLVRYTPSYTRRQRHADLSAVNHWLLVHTERRLAPRLRFGLSATGSLSTIEQFSFSPTRLASLASRPGTAADLADIVGSRPPAPDAFGAIPIVTPDSDAAASYLLFGGRVATTRIHSNLGYSLSPRLHLSFDFGLGRMQEGAAMRGEDGTRRSFMPRVTYGLGGVSLSYSISPRTQVAATATSMRQTSALRTAYLTSAGGSAQRMLSQRWFVHGAAGVGTVTNVVAVATPTRPFQFTGGGGIGFRTLSQTWLAAYNRRLGDAYGAGADGTESAGLTWRWAPPGSDWQFTLGADRFKMTGGLHMESWRGLASAGRSLSPNTAFLVEFAYMDYSSHSLILASKLSQYAVRGHFAWQPRGLRLP